MKAWTTIPIKVKTEQEQDLIRAYESYKDKYLSKHGKELTKSTFYRNLIITGLKVFNRKAETQ